MTAPATVDPVGDSPGIVRITLDQLRGPALVSMACLIGAAVVVEGVGVAVRRFTART